MAPRDSIAARGGKLSLIGIGGTQIAEKAGRNPFFSASRKDRNRWQYRSKWIRKPFGRNPFKSPSSQSISAMIAIAQGLAKSRDEPF